MITLVSRKFLVCLYFCNTVYVEKSVQQVFNWSEFYLSKMTCYKIHTFTLFFFTNSPPWSISFILSLMSSVFSKQHLLYIYLSRMLKTSGHSESMAIFNDSLIFFGSIGGFWKNEVGFLLFFGMCFSFYLNIFFRDLTTGKFRCYRAMLRTYTIPK